ncbi:MAG: hypothetical protein ACRDRB_01715 [Pseudonocardiaceae bacterium]
MIAALIGRQPADQPGALDEYGLIPVVGRMFDSSLAINLVVARSSAPVEGQQHQNQLVG